MEMMNQEGLAEALSLAAAVCSQLTFIATRFAARLRFT